jgi:hypothetical protein
MPLASCPLTREALPENDDDVAIVYSTAVPPSLDHSSNEDSRCGHEMSLLPLGRWFVQMQQDEGGGTAAAVPYCPACCTERIISIVDRRAMYGKSSHDHLAFRFGPWNFVLSVSREQLAQDRARYVLGIEGVVMIQKGRTMYPDPSKSAIELSQRLLQISNADITWHRRPTLVVMGAKTGRWGAQGGHVPR